MFNMDDTNLTLNGSIRMKQISLTIAFVVGSLIAYPSQAFSDSKAMTSEQLKKLLSEPQEYIIKGATKRRPWKT